MGTWTEMPRRTEDDLRAALAALECRTPSPEAVLGAVRGRRTRRAPGLARALRAARSPNWLVPRMAAGIAAAAAAAGLTIALLPGGAPAGHRNAAGPASHRCQRWDRDAGFRPRRRWATPC
jgi:hypothetical protein